MCNRVINTWNDWDHFLSNPYYPLPRPGDVFVIREDRFVLVVDEEGYVRSASQSLRSKVLREVDL